MEATQKMGLTERLVSGAIALGFAGATASVAIFDPVKTSIFPACPTRSFTGYACPGCGLTRGFHALFHGDVIGALDYNAMIPIYAIFLIYLFVSLVLTAVRGRGLNWMKLPAWTFYGIIGIAVIFTILRNLPFAPFDVLYP